MLAARMAPARDDRGSVRRASRLGEALAALAQELAGARREIRGAQPRARDIDAKARCGECEMNAAARHRRGVAQSFRFAPRAVGRGALGEELEWLGVVELVDERRPARWERACACGQAKKSAPDGRRESLSTRLEDARALERRP
jgi:hypothetical protein